MHYLKNTLQLFLENVFSAAITAAFPTLDDAQKKAEITTSTQPQFGHYQCNTALKLVKTVKKPPKAIAEDILQHIQHTPNIQKTEIAGNGFINIWIAPTFLATCVEASLMHQKLNVTSDIKQRIVIDFSSPNTAKEMHVGHLRSTIIGDCLARLFEFLDQDVLRLNHIGDWGTSFGMLIAYMKEQKVTDISSLSLTDLVTFYRLAKKKFDEDVAFKKTSQEEVVSLQSGEKAALDYWKIICSTSRKAYQDIYNLLDVSLIERGESFYNPMLPTIVQDLESKGLVTMCEGAKCVFLNGFKNREGKDLPLMIQKSDGGYNYDTTDMAAIYQRIHDEKAQRLIYVTDAGQATHFQMIFQAAEKAQYLDPKTTYVDHVPFGLVLGLDGKKFRTRAGDTERLIDLLTAAITKAKEILHARNPDLTEQEQEQTAHILGISAIKYADLSCNRISDYTFSYDRMLRFEGNTAAFILYSYVRVQGIKRKIEADIELLKKTAHIELIHPSEIQLALTLTQFSEILELVAQDLLPNRLTDYLYSLAETFNIFFRDCRVEGSKEQNSRLLLTEATGQTLKTGLHILGIRTLEKM